MSESISRPENYIGKHKQLKTRSRWFGHWRHKSTAKSMYLNLESPDSTDQLAKQRRYRELMTHNGEKTYLVHSTTPEKAQRILEKGLTTLGTNKDPFLERTVVMLSGPHDPNQVPNNAFNLGYTYTGGIPEPGEGPRTAKVIFEIDKPTPKIKIDRHAFRGTHLGVADDRDIIRGDTVNPHALYGTTYTIPEHRAMGYIDSSGGELTWHLNPNFEPQEHVSHGQALGEVALK